MSFERPNNRTLVFQCDACYDTFELSKDEHDLSDFRSCWNVLREDGWTLRTVKSKGGMKALQSSTEHLCGDCSQTAKADSANPFRR